jgi:hypothetical protein
VTRLIALAIVVGSLLAGCGAAVLGGSGGDSSLQITRSPGLFILPPVNRAISDPAVISRLTADINQLRGFPAGVTSCPIDFGTSYQLVLRSDGKPGLTAVISAQGCKGVKLGNGRELWAATSPKLFTDLGAALGLARDELIPFPCPPITGTVCYPQPTPRG